MKNSNYCQIPSLLFTVNFAANSFCTIPAIALIVLLFFLFDASEYTLLVKLGLINVIRFVEGWKEAFACLPYYFIIFSFTCFYIHIKTT